MLSLSISGIHFVGVDLPGFYGSPDDELYVLFYQLGVLFPFTRAHGHVSSTEREPYKKSFKVKKLVREAINLRYDLLPYLYTQFYLSSIEGAPILRPLWFDFPNDTSYSNLETQFMLGPSLLVAPKLYPAPS